MIIVKLYGLLRLDSGIKEVQTEGETVQDVFHALMQRGFDQKDLNRAVIIVNGTAAKKRTKLKDGDVVQLLSPVAGG